MEALKLIDYSYMTFYQECVCIGYITKGMFNMDHLKNMPFNEYEIIVKTVDDLTPKEGA